MFVSYILYQQQLWFFNVYSAQQIYYIISKRYIIRKRDKMNKKKKNRIVKLTQFHTNIDFTAFSTTVCYRVLFGFIAMHIHTVLYQIGRFVHSIV